MARHYDSNFQVSFMLSINSYGFCLVREGSKRKFYMSSHIEQ